MNAKIVYAVEWSEVIVTKGGLYKGTLKCQSDEDASSAARDLFHLEESLGNDSIVADRYSAEWVY